MPNKSSSAVDGYQRSSTANSLPGAHSRLIASTAATRDHGTSASAHPLPLRRSGPTPAASITPDPTSRSRTAASAPGALCSAAHALLADHPAGRFHLRRKQFQLLGLALLIEDFNRLQPARLRANCSVRPDSTASSAWTIRRAHRFHQRPVAVILAVLPPPVRSAETFCADLVMRSRTAFKRVGLHYIGSSESLVAGKDAYLTPRPKNGPNRASRVESRCDAVV